ncbi:MAG: hypothetical protein ACLRPV_16440 [Lacrimispora saccharolytica]
MIVKSCYKSSIDGTLKFQIQTEDGYVIEACVVFFPEKPAPVNICISSQIGCQCSCSFCVTGYKRFVRNLSSEEIVEQLSLIFHENPELLKYRFEITYMGTGEPLLNWDQVCLSAEIFSRKYSRLYRINISSIFPQLCLPIEKILLLDTPVHFQFSLHFVTDEMRRKYFRRELPPITSVLNRLNQIYKIKKSTYCVNYILFDLVNDSPKDAEALTTMMQSLPAYLKISKYCPIGCSTLRPSSNYEKFTALLRQAGVRWKSFESKGVDIRAACGHLLSDIQF